MKKVKKFEADLWASPEGTPPIGRHDIVIEQGPACNGNRTKIGVLLLVEGVVEGSRWVLLVGPKWPKPLPQ